MKYFVAIKMISLQTIIIYVCDIFLYKNNCLKTNKKPDYVYDLKFIK